MGLGPGQILAGWAAISMGLLGSSVLAGERVAACFSWEDSAGSIVELVGGHGERRQNNSKDK